jgi:hypothetical protein
MHELLLLVCVASFVSDDPPDLPRAPVEAAAKKASVWPWTKKDADKVERPWSLATWLGRFRDRPADGVLRVRCQNALFADRDLRASPIQIQVKEGVVELSGSVDSRALADRAERISRRTAGVKNVKNAISIEGDDVPSESVVGMQLGAPEAAAAKRPSDSNVESVAKSGPEDFKRPARTPEVVQVSSALRGSVLASRPLTVQVDPRLPRVTTYAIRRTNSESKPVVAPSEEPMDASKTSVRRSIPAPRPARAADSMSEGPRGDRNIAAVPVSRAAPNSELARRLDAEFQSDPAAKRLKYRLEGARVLLSGSTSSPERLFNFIDRLSALPGVAGVDAETGKVTFEP